jgi:CII-binding regulator of phage lambda lysogenization HflD
MAKVSPPEGALAEIHERLNQMFEQISHLKEGQEQMVEKLQEVQDTLEEWEFGPEA